MKVPVEQKISSQTVAVDYCNMSASLDIQSQPPALLSGRHSDMGDEHIPGLSREARGKLYHTTNNDKPAAAEIIDSCRPTSTATGITSSALHRETSSSNDKKCLADSPTVSFKLNSNLLSGDQILSVKTSIASCQQSLSTKKTPSSKSRFSRLPSGQ